MLKKIERWVVGASLALGVTALLALPAALRAQGICETFCGSTCGGPTSPWGICLELDGCLVSQSVCYYNINQECGCPENDEIPEG